MSDQINNNRVTVENLGQPFSRPIYSRNVWDMQVYNGKIYLGHGNSSNIGPSPNTGPEGIIYFDPSTNGFVKQYKVNDSQIDIYKILDGTLYTPGHDPGLYGGLGNFYRLENDSWQKYHNVPYGIHSYDMESFGGNLFISLGSTNMNIVLTSSDNGLTWTNLEANIMSKFSPKGGRAYTLFKFRNILYASNTFYNFTSTNYNNLLFIRNMIVDGKPTFVSAILKAHRMVPEAPVPGSYRLVRPTEFNGSLLYIAATQYNDHQYIPYGLYYSKAVNKAQKVSLPESSALPIDILVRGKTLYLLAYLKISDNEYVNIVYSTIDGIIYTEVFRFTQDTFARSFEEINGVFYFGLGCYADILPESTGSILRVKNNS